MKTKVPVIGSAIFMTPPGSLLFYMEGAFNPIAVELLESSYGRGGYNNPRIGKWLISQPFVVQF